MMKKFFGLIVICLFVVMAALLIDLSPRTRGTQTQGVASRKRSTPGASGSPGETSRPQPLPIPVGNQTGPSTTTPPTSDTIPANPSNRMIFAAAGPFEVYRQGNLTWRVDTNSGKTCVLFATDSEWRKARVYRQACAAT